MENGDFAAGVSHIGRVLGRLHRSFGSPFLFIAVLELLIFQVYFSNRILATFLFVAVFGVRVFVLDL